MRYIITSFFLLLLNSMDAQTKKTVATLEVPGKFEYARIDEKGVSVISSGRYISPAGEMIRITHDPFGMRVSPDGAKAITLHNGVFTIIDLTSMKPTRVPSYDGKIPSPFSKGSFLGVDFGDQSNIVYLSGGDNGAVLVYDIQQMRRLDSISLNGKVGDVLFEDSFTSDLLYNTDKKELLVLDRANFRMVRINMQTRQIEASIPCGRLPFGLSISPDKKYAFVANVGMYAYPLIEGMTEQNYDSLLIPHHPYGDNTKESINGTVIDGKKIPGVGSPASPEAMSVFVIDLATNKVLSKLKTGHQIGELIEDIEVVGGASPNSIAVGKQLAYITNATNDNISVIDYRTQKIVKHIPIKVSPLLDKYRGLLPFGITVSKDGKKLYVALLGFNAVAVIDTKTRTTLGLIPTGWGPTRVKLSPDEKEIYVISCRGLGAGPNGGKDFKAPVQGTFVGDIQLASFQRIAVPDINTLNAYTKTVIENTYEVVPVKADKNPLPPTQMHDGSPIKYVVYITKENRTYDEVLGDRKEAIGDASLARFGDTADVIVRKRKSDGSFYDSLAVPKARITPNHHKIAKKFASSDNFYCDSDASIHGHHWMMGVIPNEWVETNSNTSKTANYFSKAPGRRFPGSTGSMDPEDFAETGGLWEALERKGISFYNFGEANETAHVREEWNDTATGASHGVMVPMQKALWTRTSHNFAGYNTNIPDQFRMKQFEEEFTKKWFNGKDSLPQLLTVMLPNDHGAR